MGVLLAANLVSLVVPDERSREVLAHAPPGIAWLRAILWRTDARDTVLAGGIGLPGLDGDVPTTVFSTRPSPVARLGQAYEYRPQTTLPLSNFDLRGAPDGISVDAQTGAIAGSATVAGTYEVVLTGQTATGHIAEQRFRLFADDRLLPLGADRRGRSLVRRLLSAARYTLAPGLLAVAIGIGLGTPLGALGGFHGGPAGRLVRGLTTVIQSVPGLLLAVSMVVVGLILLPETASGIAERVEEFRKREFVEAGRELGLTDRTILWNEIVWHNARGFILTRISYGFVFAIFAEVTLSYMGLADPNSASLGVLLLDAREALAGDRSHAEATVGLTALIGIVATFSLMERGVLRLWDRRR
jgi:peptide/nickel transport system permease protein